MQTRQPGLPHGLRQNQKGSPAAGQPRTYPGQQQEGRHPFCRDQTRRSHFHQGKQPQHEGDQRVSGVQHHGSGIRHRRQGKQERHLRPCA